jgi:uncharacterized protein
MNVNGEYRIPAPRERVWQALHDAETLRACIPGCEEVRRNEDGVFEGRLTVRVGAALSAFSGQASVGEVDYPNGYTVTAHVQGVASGSADGEATVTLTPEGGGTLVSYRARLEPHGRLATVGPRLLHGAAIRLANEFFVRLIERLTPRTPAAIPQELAEPVPVPRPAGSIKPIAPAPLPAAAARPGVDDPVQVPLATGNLSRTSARILWGGVLVWLIIVLLLFWPRG